MSYAVAFWTVAGMCVWKAMEYGGMAWLLCWPGVSFAVAGAAYAGIGPRVYGKQPDGTLAIVNAALLLPYLLYTWAVWHLWRLSSREPPFHELCDRITIGRRLLGREMPERITAVFDLTSEFIEPRRIRWGTNYRYVAALDGRTPNVWTLKQVAAAITAHAGEVYIHCANGRGRTGTLAAAALLTSGRAKTPAEAIAFIQSRRPSVALKGVQVEALTKLAALLKEDAARLERSHEILEHSSEGPIVRFAFRGVHDSTHGGQMDTYVRAVAADTRAAGIVVDLLDYEYEFGNDVFALCVTGYDPVSDSQRPLCIVAQGRTRASLAGLLQSSNLPGLEGTLVASTDEALQTVMARLAAARRAREEAIEGGTPSAGDEAAAPASRHRDVIIAVPALFLALLGASIAELFFLTSVWAWVPFGVVALVGGHMIAANWATFVRRRTGGDEPMIPFLGGVLLAIALARCPVPAVRGWWWVPLILDPTCLPTLAGYLMNLVWDLVKRGERGAKP